MALKLEGEVSLDGSGFERGLEKISHGATHVAGELKNLALAAFGIYSVEQALHKTAERMIELAETSERLGVGVEELQKLQYAALLAGVQAEKLTDFLEKVSKAKINPALLPHFEKLGISQEDLAKPVEEIVRMIALTVRHKNPQEFVGDLAKVGGKGAGAVIPMLKDDLEELGEEAERLHAIMTADAIASVKVMGDELKSLLAVILGSLGPVIGKLAVYFSAFVDLLKATVVIIAELGKQLGNITKSDLISAVKFMATAGLAGDVVPLGKKIEKALFFAFGEGSEALDKFNEESIARIQRMRDKLNHPDEPGDEERNPPEDKPEKQKRHTLASDSLTSIGNFLGASKSPVERIMGEHTHLLRAIRDNTSHLKKQPTQHQHASGVNVPHN